MKTLLLAIILATGTNAFATGGFDCTYAKDGINLSVTGVTSRGFQSAIVDAGGVISGSVGDDGVVYKFNHNLVRQDIVQYWNSERELRLIVYSENAAGEEIKAVIKTSTTNDIDYTGTLELSGGMWSMNDSIACTVE